LPSVAILVLEALFNLMFFTVLLGGIGGAVHSILTGKGLDL
jgi:hypothetical protein